MSAKTYDGFKDAAAVYKALSQLPPHERHLLLGRPDVVAILGRKEALKLRRQIQRRIERYQRIGASACAALHYAEFGDTLHAERLVGVERLQKVFARKDIDKLGGRCLKRAPQLAISYCKTGYESDPHKLWSGMWPERTYRIEPAIAAVHEARFDSLRPSEADQLREIEHIIAPPAGPTTTIIFYAATDARGRAMISHRFASDEPSPWDATDDEKAHVDETIDEFDAFIAEQHAEPKQQPPKKHRTISDVDVALALGQIDVCIIHGMEREGLFPASLHTRIVRGRAQRDYSMRAVATWWLRSAGEYLKAWQGLSPEETPQKDAGNAVS